MSDTIKNVVLALVAGIVGGFLIQGCCNCCKKNDCCKDSMYDCKDGVCVPKKDKK